MSLDERGRSAGADVRSTSAAGLEADTMLRQLERTRTRRLRARVAVVGVAAASLVVAGWLVVQPRDEAAQLPVGPTPGPSVSHSTSGSPTPTHLRRNGAVVFADNDGQFVAVDSHGARILASRMLLPKLPPDFLDSASWSPDGRELAYSLNHEIRVADVTTGASRRVSTCPGCSVAWSPDGQRLAVTTGPSLEIWSLTGDQRTVVLKGGPATRVLREPAWSPDGRRIAFVVWDYRTAARTTQLLVTSLQVVAIDGSGLTTLFGPTNWNHEQHETPSWSPDGGRIAFIQSTESSGHFAVSLATVPARGGSKTTLLRTGLCFALLRPAGVAWSPDGRRLAVVGGGCGPVFVSANARVSAPRVSTVRQFAGGATGPLSWQPVR
jgi:Tol biopolymer transport system component